MTININHTQITLGEEHWDKLNLAQQVGLMDNCFQSGNIFAIKQALIAGDYQKAVDIMCKLTHDNFHARAEVRASFLEEGKIQFDNIHLVKPGETLKAISDKHGLSLNAIKKLNPKLYDTNNFPLEQKLISKAKKILILQ